LAGKKREIVAQWKVHEKVSSDYCLRWILLFNGLLRKGKPSLTGSLGSMMWKLSGRTSVANWTDAVVNLAAIRRLWGISLTRSKFMSPYSSLEVV
jgi:hypothetical protein